ncbi:MAG: hypothetical protein OCD03_07330 [Hyphomicrobiales bacterium]
MSKTLNILKSHKLLIILGLAAFFSISSWGQDLTVLFSIDDDLHLFFLLFTYALPAFIIALLTTLVTKFTGLKWYFTSIIALTLLALPAIYLNVKSEAEISELLASDIDTLKAPQNIQTLAYINNRGYNGAPVCDDFCARILLNQQVKKIIIANWQATPTDYQFNLNGTAFWLEAGEHCESPQISTNLNKLALIKTDEYFDTDTPENLMLLRAGQGSCLLQADANMRQADAALVYGVLQRGQTEFDAGLDTSAQTVGADRLSFFHRENGIMQLKYQTTLAQNNGFWGLLLPYISTANYAAQLAFMRHHKGDDVQYLEATTIPFSKFLTDKLKLHLWLDEPEIGEQVSEILRRTLGGSDKIGVAKLQIIDSLLENMNMSDDLHSGRANMYLAIFKDKRIPITIHSGNVLIDNIHGNPQLVDDFAEILFERLEEYKLVPSPDGNEELQNIAIALSYLPQKALKPHFEQLKSLANNRHKRLFLRPLLSHLANIGPDALPILLSYIDEANSSNQADANSSSRWEGMYLTGMNGLCELAQSTINKPAIKEAVLQRLDEGNIALFGNHWDKVVHLLYALDIEANEIWLKLQKLDIKRERDDFDEQITSAKQKINCGWHG